jgi:hypothetical protein
MITWNQYIVIVDNIEYFIKIIRSIITLNYYPMPNNPDYIERYNRAKNNIN